MPSSHGPFANAIPQTGTPCAGLFFDTRDVTAHPLGW